MSRRYGCAEYYEAFTDGVFDEESQLWVISPQNEVHIDEESLMLVVGRPGADGVLFGYREGLAGLWAYYPIERSFEPVAATLRELVDAWLSGQISV